MKKLFAQVLISVLALGCLACTACTKEKPPATPPPKPALPYKINLVWQHDHKPEVDLSRLDKVPGCRITASNGRGSFLPAAGNRTNALVAEQSGGYYWSASLDLRFSDQATSLLVEAPRAELVAQPRFMGLSIRPVCQ